MVRLRQLLLRRALEQRSYARRAPQSRFCSVAPPPAEAAAAAAAVAAATAAGAGWSPPVSGVSFRGKAEAGLMSAAELQAALLAPGGLSGVALFEGWAFRHQWGSSHVEAVFVTREAEGQRRRVEVCVRQYFNVARRARRRTEESVKGRDHGLHDHCDTRFETRDWRLSQEEDDEVVLEISVRPAEEEAASSASASASAATLYPRISAFASNGVIVLRSLTFSTPAPLHAHLACDTYKGPELTDFDTAYALLGGKGYAWDPSAEPFEGWAEKGAAKTPVETVHTAAEAAAAAAEEEEEALAAAGGDAAGVERAQVKEAFKEQTKKALKRALLGRRGPGDVLLERRMRRIVAARRPPQLRFSRDPSSGVGTRHVHEPFACLSPTATDALYDYLDALGVNDPNLQKLAEVARHVQMLEEGRQVHAVMGVLQAEAAEATTG
eukprot:Rhum_TRINITY_DN14316_c9_g2::Rhum_TRINITY_DN14316_c9_g2_i1::g.82397::m.82397